MAQHQLKPNWSMQRVFWGYKGECTPPSKTIIPSLDRMPTLFCKTGHPQSAAKEIQTTTPTVPRVMPQAHLLVDPQVVTPPTMPLPFWEC